MKIGDKITVRIFIKDRKGKGIPSMVPAVVTQVFDKSIEVTTNYGVFIIDNNHTPTGEELCE